MSKLVLRNRRAETFLGGLTVLLSLLLAACGGEVTAPATTSASNSNPPAPVSSLASAVATVAPAQATNGLAATSQTTKAAATTVSAPPAQIVQPKIVHTETDSLRMIQFTEQPNLKDGSPTLLWFDAVG